MHGAATKNARMYQMMAAGEDTPESYLNYLKDGGDVLKKFAFSNNSNRIVDTGTVFQVLVALR